MNDLTHPAVPTDLNESISAPRFFSIPIGKINKNDDSSTHDVWGAGQG